MENFKGKFTKINGLSDKRRFPRKGKIRLGVKVENKEGKFYPREVDYFVVPPEVANIYGDKPKELDVMLLVDDPEIIFPQAYKAYGSSKGLKCIGSGIKAMRANEKGEMEERDCPCEWLNPKEVDGKKQKQLCSKRASLMVMLPKVSLAEIYQIDLSSFNSIIDINSGLDYVKAMCFRFAMIPLKLKRVPTETHHDGKKQIHYTLKLTLDNSITADQINMLREKTKYILADTSRNLIEAPKDENPEMDEGAIVVRDEEEGDDAVPVQAEVKPVSPTSDDNAQPEESKDVPGQTRTSISEAQRKRIMVLCNKLNIGDGARHKILRRYYKKTSTNDLTIIEAGGLINMMQDAINGKCDLSAKDADPVFEYPPENYGFK